MESRLSFPQRSPLSRHFATSQIHLGLILKFHLHVIWEDGTLGFFETYILSAEMLPVAIDNKPSRFQFA